MNAMMNYSVFGVDYVKIRDYFSKACDKSIVLIKNHYNQRHPKLLEIDAVSRRYLFNSFNAGKAFLWTHQRLIVGGVVIVAALFILHHYWKNRPQEPVVNKKTTQDLIVKMASTLNFATLSIMCPKKEKPAPPNVMLNFCIDTSASMHGERIDAVKRAVKNILDQAQKVVDTTEGANIGISIIAFDTKARITTPSANLVAKNNKINGAALIEEIKKEVDGIKTNGSTKILNGLKKVTEETEKTAKINKNTSQTVILLTDGEDNLYEGEIKSIQTRLSSVGAKLYAIGIGNKHQKTTLENLVTSSIKEFCGEYIDTTLGKDTIESAISSIYVRAISSFNELELTTPQLESGTWRVINTSFSTTGKSQKYSLGSLSEGATMNKVIEIFPDKLKAPLDLSTLKFNLTYTDPKGKKEEVSLSWNPNTTIDNKIILATKKK
jgi:Mg-chelatase subunit ChlD